MTNLKKTLLLLLLINFNNIKAQVNVNNVVNTVTNAINNSGVNLTQQEIVNGLKEALTVGANNATSSVAKVDGFYRNRNIRIPFPEDAQRMKTSLEAVGMKKQVNKFEVTLNRAAEEAAKEAAPILRNAIQSMSITDAVNILKGSDNAATLFLNKTTNAQLRTQFKPIVQRAMQKVEVTKYWRPLITRYNRIPGAQKMNPDLEEYVTLKTIEGVFKLIAEEELKIRRDPAARTSDLLKKVFG
jgi:polyribonucleotide nucleotidyltransferase